MDKRSKSVAHKSKTGRGGGREGGRKGGRGTRGMEGRKEAERNEWREGGDRKGEKRHRGVSDINTEGVVVVSCCIE